MNRNNITTVRSVIRQSSVTAAINFYTTHAAATNHTIFPTSANMRIVHSSMQIPVGSIDS
ncbi:hypothetical protein C0J52_14719 [Blattella germanica]|nr:hypothetical protein C0J52_14719 [Blattella germanica]